MLDRAIAEADVAGFPARRAASAEAGKLRGIGLAYYIELILGDQNESTTIAFADDGMVELHVGTQSNGQGHETAFAQVLHERSGIPFENIRFVQGDSDLIPDGGGTGGSRSATMQGNSINFAADEVIARFRPLAEDELEVASEDLVFEDGAFRIAGTDRAIGLVELAEVARRAGRTELLTTRREFVTPGRSYPNGAHICEVEIERDTGRTAVVKYTVVDDFGYLLNPMLAEGQVHGGVAQGIGQAVTEQVSFAAGRAAPVGVVHGLCDAAGERRPVHGVPCRARSLDGEPDRDEGLRRGRDRRRAAAVTNAALDAVWVAGVRHVDMPLTPVRVWEWLQAAEAAAPAEASGARRRSPEAPLANRPAARDADRMAKRPTPSGLRIRVVFPSGTMIGPGKADLLEGIRDTGSIAAACRRMGMSYKRAWMLVETMNAGCRAPLVASARGGAAHGGATLTAARRRGSRRPIARSRRRRPRRGRGAGGPRRRGRGYGRREIALAGRTGIGRYFRRNLSQAGSPSCQAVARSTPSCSPSSRLR